MAILYFLRRLFGCCPQCCGNHNHHFNIEGAKFMYIVKDDNPPVGFSVDTSDVVVSDAEGHTIEGAEVKVEVASDNSDAVAIDAAADGKSGTANFGAPGNAGVTATFKDSAGNVLKVLGAQFHVTTGDPKAIAGGSLKFEGLTEATETPA